VKAIIPSNNIAADMADRLAQQAETFTAYLLPNGKRDGAHWIVGSINGEKGQSLKVTLTGEKVGKWIDYADDTQHGDLLDLLAAVRSMSLSDALREAKDYLGLSGANFDGQAYKPKPRLPKSQETPEQANQRRQKDARKREKAKAYWDKGKPCTSHPYTTRKNTKPDGLREYEGNLVAALFNADGQIQSVQIINPEGKKRFLKGCKMAGCYSTIGKPINKTIVIVEGWATGMSVHMATGQAVAVSFSSGNLPKVARLMRQKYPTFRIILAPDNDQ